MSRSLTAAVTTELTAAAVSPVLFYEGEFDSGYLRCWTGVGDKSWNGSTWQGVGHVFDISQIQESGETSANGVTVVFTAIPSSMVSLALADVQQNLPGKIWLGFLSSAGAVMADPVLLFEGRCDVTALEEGPELSTLSITYESRLIDLQRPRERRYTDQEQQALYAGDLGCAFVASLQEATVIWGRAG